MTPQKSAFLIAPLLLLAALLWLWFSGDAAVPTPVVGSSTGVEAERGTLEGAGAAPPPAAAERRLTSGAGARGTPAGSDPEYTAALSGFTGRVVDEERHPQAGSVVRFYRLDPEILQFKGLFAEDDEVDLGPDATSGLRLQIHEATTGDDGRFTVTGAWPHAFYILEADALGENRLTMPVDHLPGPGEVVDLGDIVLKRLGVIVGRVVDESGAGVPDVAVHAQDVPGAFLDFAPVERFDPEGAVLIREADPPMVIEMPRFVKRYYDLLLKPATVTMADGRFRLAGVQPGDNVMVFKRRGFVPTTRKGVRVSAGAEKDVGTVELGEGEVAYVEVVDSDDEPVAGAEVLVAATTTLFPVDFASRAGVTDAAGKLTFEGVPKGRITVAARRSRSHPWVCAQPVNVNSDAVVRLPSRHHFDLTIKSAAGVEIVGPEFKLMPALDGNAPLDVGVLGFVKWLDIDDKVERRDDGRYRIRDLEPGQYTLAVTARDHGAARLDFKIGKSAAGEVTLRPESRFVVLVVDPDGAPVRRAKVYMRCPRPEDGARFMEMPIVAGETDVNGRLVVKEGEAGKLRVSASHPAYGMAHAEGELPTDQPIVLQMTAPAELIGRLTEAGRPPVPGKWSIVLEPRWGQQRVRGAMPNLPKLTVPGIDGTFRSQGLRPGGYRLRVIKSISAINSPGGMIGFFMQARMMSNTVTKDVVLEAGQPTYVELDAIKAPEAIDGPSARVSGTVFVNGRPGAGMMVTGRGERRFGVTADKTGRFDLGPVPAGSLRLSVHDPEQAGVVDMRMEGHLWRRDLEVKGGEDLVLDIDVSTGRLTGRATVGGAPARMVRVKAVGGVAKSEGQPGRSSAAVAMTDQQGRFTFDQLPAGRYRVEVTDRRQGHGTSGPHEVLAGGLVTGVVVSLAKTYRVSGRVDLSAIAGDEPPRWVYLQFRGAGGGKEQTAGVRKDGRFRARGIPPGEYAVQVFAADDGGRPREYAAKETVRVVDRDVADVLLTPVPKPTGSRK